MQSPREMLVPVTRRTRAWVEFDPEWYRRTYGIGPEITDLLNYYLNHGQALGHSPNVFFDEAWYLRRYRDVTGSVQAGRFASGFDHYCRSGFAGRSPHWLFLAAFYESGAPDLTPEALAVGGFLNSYDHFLRVGGSEGRLGHPLFDSAFYHATRDDPGERGVADAACPYAEFLYRLSEKRGEIAVSVYFDAEWYIARYPVADDAIRSGDFLSALHHYLCNDRPTSFDPLADFSESFYLGRYPDVAEAVRSGAYLNGYIHFLQNGARELRGPAPHIDLLYYWSRNSACRRAVEAKHLRDAFAHLLTIGKRRGLALAPYQPPPGIPTPTTRALIAARAQTILPLYGRFPLDFTLSGPPECSVLLLLRNGLAITMRTLAALREHYRGSIELILIDTGEVDEVRQIERFVTGATFLRFGQVEVDPGRAGNAALETVAAEYVLVLASDVQLARGALAAALARIASDSAIGAVGGKIVGSDEALLEAGAIVWRDGRVMRYLEGRSPLVPEANFVRDVDFCFGGCLLARAGLLRRLGGLDIQLAPTRFGDADLGIRIWQSGHRVIYDPAMLSHRFEDDGGADQHALRALSRARHRTFFNKHLASLRFRHAMSPAAIPFARAVDGHRRRVLFVEHTVPLRMLGSGWVRANDIVRLMVELDYHVTVYPLRASEVDMATVAAEFPDTVEVMHDRALAGFRAFLEARPGYYDCIWVSRTNNLDLVRPVLEDAALVPSRTRIILDTEAVAAARSALRSKVLGEAMAAEPDEALRKEFSNAFFCQQVLTVNERERQLLSALGIPDVRVLGTVAEPKPTPDPYERRAGMLFVGSLHATDTPNWDSLTWFADSVLPLIEARLGYETRLTVAGYASPWVPMARFTHSRITLAGPVVDLAPLYGRHRVVVAPTRFAAGTPYKVYEAAAFGVPVVATSLLREQLGWEDGVELLSAPADDPAGFAEKVVTLYRSEPLWNSVREAAIERLRRENSRALIKAVLKDLLPEHDNRPATRGPGD